MRVVCQVKSCTVNVPAGRCFDRSTWAGVSASTVQVGKKNQKLDMFLAGRSSAIHLLSLIGVWRPRPLLPKDSWKGWGRGCVLRWNWNED